MLEEVDHRRSPVSIKSQTCSCKRPHKETRGIHWRITLNVEGKAPTLTQTQEKLENTSQLVYGDNITL